MKAAWLRSQSAGLREMPLRACSQTASGTTSKGGRVLSTPSMATLAQRPLGSPRLRAMLKTSTLTTR